MAKKHKPNEQKKTYEETYPNLYRYFSNLESDPKVHPDVVARLRKSTEELFEETEQIVQALYHNSTFKDDVQEELSGLSKILNSLTLDQPANASEYKHIVLVHEKEINITRRLKNQGIDISRLILWYRETPDLSINDLCSFVERKLQERNHPSNESIAQNFLALFSLTRQIGKSPLQHLNDMFELILPAKITVFYILPVDSLPGLRSCKFGPYSYGELPLRELQRADRLSDRTFLKEYGHVIKGKMAITRRMPNIQLVDWIPLLNKRTRTYSRRQLVVSGWAADTYYDKVNTLLFDMFFGEMIQHQHLTIALGSLYIDPDKYRNQKDVITIVANEYSSVENEKPTGLISSRLHLDIRDVDPAIFDIPLYNKQLREKYNFTDYKDIPLHHTLQTYSQFIARARMLEDKHKPSEAFLQYVIALELVFAGRETISSTIARRVAAVTYKQTNSDYELLRQRIRQDYKLRSLYVHEGQSINSQQLTSIAEICHYVLHAILYLQQEFPQISIDTWMENIDLLVSKLSNNEQPNDELLRSCGAVYPDGWSGSSLVE